MLRPLGPGVPGARVSPDVPVGGFTYPFLWAAALGAAQPCGVSLTTGGIAPASLWYDRPLPVARVAGPRCLAGDPVLGCVPARLSLVVAMAPGDVCHGCRCSPAGHGPVALEYRSCHWPGRLGGSPQCVRPWGCGSLRPVPLPPSVHVRVRCPEPLVACSPMGALCDPCAVSVATSRLLPVRVLCAACVCCWWLCRGRLPPSCVFAHGFFSSFCLVPSVISVCSSILFSDAFFAFAYPAFLFFFR